MPAGKRAIEVPPLIRGLRKGRARGRYEPGDKAAARVGRCGLRRRLGLARGTVVSALAAFLAGRLVRLYPPLVDPEAFRLSDRAKAPRVAEHRPVGGDHARPIREDLARAGADPFVHELARRQLVLVEELQKLVGIRPRQAPEGFDAHGPLVP